MWLPGKETRRRAESRLHPNRWSGLCSQRYHHNLQVNKNTTILNMITGYYWSGLSYYFSINVCVFTVRHVRHPGISPSLKVQSWLRMEPKASSLDSEASSATLRSTYTIICFSWHTKTWFRLVSKTPTSLKSKRVVLYDSVCMSTNMCVHRPNIEVLSHKPQFCFGNVAKRCNNCLRQD